MITIDQLFSQVISLTARVDNSKERDDMLYLARDAYSRDDYRLLTNYFQMLRRLPAVPVFKKATPVVPREKHLGPNVEASGLPNPKVYDYFTNYNSPLNQAPMRYAPSFPLYSNFGAYKGL